MSDLEVLLTIVGLAAVTLLTRGFLMLPTREWPLPGWLNRGLRYVPLAALVAVVVPSVVLAGDGALAGWRDARWFAAAAAAAWYFWRRSILGTIVAGSAVMTALRLGLGW